MKVLVVRDAFGDYAVGQMIRDPQEMQAVRDAGQAHYCTASDVPDSFFAPDPEPAAEAAPAPAKGKSAAA